MESKQRFVRALSQRETDRIPVVPFVYCFAARLRGLSVKEMLNDPTLLANSLADVNELYGFDGLAVPFDMTLEAEACGCEVAWEEGTPPSVTGHPLGIEGAVPRFEPQRIEESGRIPLVLDVIRRLKAVMGSTRAMIGVATGPLTLFEQLKGASFSGLLGKRPNEAEDLLDLSMMVATRMVQVYGEQGLDAVMIADRDLSVEDEKGLDAALPEYESLSDIARYFDAIPMFMFRGCRIEHLQIIIDAVGSECLVLRDEPDCRYLVENSLLEDGAIGWGVPTESLPGDPDVTRAIVEKDLGYWRGTGAFLCTDWEVPLSVPIDSLRAMVEAAEETASSGGLPGE